jgi:hypothetical protein
MQCISLAKRVKRIKDFGSGVFIGRSRVHLDMTSYRLLGRVWRIITADKQACGWMLEIIT